MTRIAICAPSAPFTREDAAKVQALAAGFPDIDLYFHDQCFAVEGHFAGSDRLRLRAFLDCANDESFDAVWFARGGYGSNRIARDVIAQLGKAAGVKTFLGYSDGGYMLAALYKAGIGQAVHGPMPADIRREGGETAVLRALGYLAGGREGLEPSLQAGVPAAAFNLMTLAMLLGTPLMPDLTGHVVMVEEVSEHLYAIDRLFFHVTSLLPPGIAGLRLGQVTDVPENDREFGQSVEEIAEYWCERSGIAFLGRSEIGHTASNRLVPFGLASPPRKA